MTESISRLERDRVFRQASAFLSHWQDPLSGGEGEGAILSELDISEEQIGFVCALARMAWQMAKAADDAGIEQAVRYVQDVAAEAAADEAGAGNG